MKRVSIGITALVLGGCACLTVVPKHRDSVPAVDVLEQLYRAGFEVYKIRAGATVADDGDIFLAHTNMCVPDPVVDVLHPQTAALSAAEHAERVAALKARAFRRLRGLVYGAANETTAPPLTIGTNACQLYKPTEEK